MQWSEVLNDPSLRDLPYKIETNAEGQIVMSPLSNRRGLLKARIAMLIHGRLAHGEVLTGSPIDTTDGVKVADVAWCSDFFLQTHGLVSSFPRAPELCVEIRLPSNSTPEMHRKRDLYIDRGAREVWVVSEDGSVLIFDAAGERPASALGQFDFSALAR